MLTTRTRAGRLTTSAAVALAALVATGTTVSAARTSTASPSGSPSTSTSPSISTEDADRRTPNLTETQTSSDGVDVRTYGVVTVHPYQDAANPPAVMALHGVRRVEGATVVYYSAGWQEGEEVEASGLNEHSGPGARNGGYTSGGTVGTVRITDVAGGQVYRTVADPRDSAITQALQSEQEAFPDEPGVMGTMFAVLPELPETTRTVDVQLLWGVTIPDVPVEEGLLEPTADPDTVIPLGTGWPEVDMDAVAHIQPESFVYPITSVVEALDESQVVREQGATVTVDLAADVLFAFDSADLNPDADTKLTQVAATIRQRGATGGIQIIGHTDDEGTDAYNDDLSRRRASAVAEVLRPALEGVPATFTVEGRGESEPVADNDSEEGRQANRRVSITYTAQGDS